MSKTNKTESQEMGFEDKLWVEYSLNDFEDTLRGCYEKPTEEFARIVITKTSEFLNAIRGAFFALNFTGDRIYFAGGYSCSENTVQQKTFAIGDGLIGQAALGKKKIYFENLPQGNLLVETALGKISATCLFIHPLVFNDKIFGVIELVFLKSLSDREHVFLQKLCRDIAAILSGIQANQQTLRLLEQSRLQADELRSQEEELRQTLEEMQATEEELNQQVMETLAVRKEMEARVGLLNKSALVTETDLFGTITYVNEKFCQITQYTPEECIGKPHNMIRHPDTPKELFKEMWTTLKAGKVFTGILKNRAKDGSAYWVEANVAPVFDENDKPYKYVAIRFDITERVLQEEAIKKMLEEAMLKEETLKQQEEELRQNIEELYLSNEQLNSVMNHLSKSEQELKARIDFLNRTALVTETDLFGTITYANEKFLEVSKYTLEECVGKPHSMVRHPDTPKEVFKEMWATIKAGKNFHATYKNKAKDGSSYWVEAHISPVVDEYGKPYKFIGIRFDITQRVKDMEALKKAMEAADQKPG